MHSNSYHIRSARGDVERSKPIVAGRCPCSRAYASPWAPKAIALSKPFSSASLMSAGSTPSGGIIKAKLTVMRPSVSSNSFCFSLFFPFSERGWYLTCCERPCKLYDEQQGYVLQNFLYHLLELCSQFRTQDPREACQ